MKWRTLSWLPAVALALVAFAGCGGGGTSTTPVATLTPAPNPDLFTLSAPVTVFTPSGAGTPAFDADYAGSGSVFPAANGTDLLMIYHAENHLFGGVDHQASPFYASIGLARSTDGGVTC